MSLSWNVDEETKEIFIVHCLRGRENIGYYFPCNIYHFISLFHSPYFLFFSKYQTDIGYTKNEPHINCSMRSLYKLEFHW